MEADQSKQEVHARPQPPPADTPPDATPQQQPQPPCQQLTPVEATKPHHVSIVESGDISQAAVQVPTTQPSTIPQQQQYQEQHQQQPNQLSSGPTSEPANKELQSQHAQHQPPQQQSPSPIASPQRAVITKVKLSDELTLFDWSRTKEFINQIAQHAKSSVESVMTTLDPGMKEYLYSGGNINIMVICDSDSMVSPVRDAFQTVFGRATVVAARYDSSSHFVKLAHNFEGALKIAKEKISAFRNDTSNVPQNQVVVAIQPSLVHIFTTQQPQTSERPFFTYALLIDDPILGVFESCYSQLIPLDIDTVSQLSSHSFSETDQHNNVGWSLSIEEVMAPKLKIQAPGDITTDNSTTSETSDNHWLTLWSGQQVSEAINRASISLAHMYKRIWDQCIGGDPA